MDNAVSKEISVKQNDKKLIQYFTSLIIIVISFTMYFFYCKIFSNAYLQEK